MFENFAFLDIGVPELLLILLILLLLFGGRKLPQLSKGLVNAMRELKKGFSDDVREDKPGTKDKK